jgi:glucosamine-6-phosphate deaminase
MHRQEGLSFRHVVTFNLDEYYPMEPGSIHSYHRFMWENLFAQLDIRRENIHIPRGDVPRDRVDDECRRYEDAIRAAGGIDLQLLGIGRTGHIGFNEPGSSLASRTRIKTLTDRTRRDNARFFPSFDDVPRHVITQGVGTILEARHLVLLAFGAAKAEAVARAVEGPVTAMVPGSALQLHPHVSVVVDEPAAACLALAGYYRETWAHKPSWQGL